MLTDLKIFFAHGSVSKIFRPKIFFAYRSVSKIFFLTNLKLEKNVYGSKDFFAHRSVSKIFVPYRSRGQKELLTDLDVFCLKICKQTFSLQIKRWKRIAYRSSFFWPTDL